MANLYTNRNGGIATGIAIDKWSSLLHYSHSAVPFSAVLVRSGLSHLVILDHIWAPSASPQDIPKWQCLLLHLSDSFTVQLTTNESHLIRSLSPEANGPQRKQDSAPSINYNNNNTQAPWAAICFSFQLISSHTLEGEDTERVLWALQLKWP